MTYNVPLQLADVKPPLLYILDTAIVDILLKLLFGHNTGSAMRGVKYSQELQCK